MENPLLMVIFNSYVKLPEGKDFNQPMMAILKGEIIWSDDKAVEGMGHPMALCSDKPTSFKPPQKYPKHFASLGVNYPYPKSGVKVKHVGVALAEQTWVSPAFLKHAANKDVWCRMHYLLQSLMSDPSPRTTTGILLYAWARVNMARKFQEVC